LNKRVLYPLVRRVVDETAAGFGLLLFAPVGLLVAAAIAADSRGPIFYGGKRVGKNGVPFRMWKFRTMVPDAESRGSSVSRDGDARVTRVGRFLRWSKLDELPQLWNVLLGEMSLVGPRPDAPEIVETYTAPMRRALDVRPGITSVASLWLRNESRLLAGSASPDEVYETIIVPAKVNLALAHLDRQSLLFDWGILLATVGAWLHLRRPNREEKEFLRQLKSQIEAHERPQSNYPQRTAR
jgi:lipopolysaccharide/colanic/teichoic acid biosynthesis glycosyltransferase